MSTPEEVAYHQTRMSKLRDYYCQINTMTGWLRRVDASRETLEANLVLLAAVADELRRAEEQFPR